MGFDAEWDEMNERWEPLDRDTAEGLLGGDFSVALNGAASLASLLASAASAPQAHELAGEDAAILSFREAQRDRAHRRISFWRRVITFKVLAAVTAATAGGLAFASSTGMLPAPFSVVQQPPKDSPADTDRTSRPANSPHPDQPLVGPSGSAMPSESVAGLCNAYLAKSPEERGKALDSPSFAQLIVLAGGVNNVDSYCQGLEADKVEKSHSPRPSRKAQ
jgi:hypothetical protein